MELAALIADVSGRLLLSEASPGPQVKKGKCISKFPNAFLSTLCMLLATWNYCQRRESLKEQSVVPQSPNQWPWEGNFLSSHRTSDRCLANLLLKTSHNSFSSLPSSFCFVLLSPHSWFAGSPGIHHKDVQHWSGEQLSQKQHLLEGHCPSPLLVPAKVSLSTGSLRDGDREQHPNSTKDWISKPFTQSFTTGISRRSELLPVTQPGNPKMQLLRMTHTPGECQPGSA